jgi:hypothetical protein
MLHKYDFIITPETFKLIQELQKLEYLKDFYLVGGTALALQIGHRNSIDIDLFTNDNFNGVTLIENVRSHFEFRETYNRPNTIMGTVNSIKVDFIRHNYNLVLAPIQENGITFLSKEDIAAMKLNAITHSGKRLKDFIDIYFLLEYFSMEQMLKFYALKYPLSNELMPLKSITFFDDIDENIDPPKLVRPLPLDKIKERILEGVKNTRKIF